MDFDPHLLSSYQYELPERLIAQHPLQRRDESRLLVLDRSKKKITHAKFRDLPEFLESGNLVVANNTKVLKARLLGNRIAGFSKEGSPELGGKVEFLMLEELEPLVWEGAFHAAAKHKPGVRFFISTPDGKGLTGELIRGASESKTGTVVARFDRDPVASGAGEIPLPPYVERSPVDQDLDRYQTVYAREEGSAAAPTAGLHFTEELRQQLVQSGILWDEVTLHVGLGTFRPVKASDIREHAMHEERFSISRETAQRIQKQKQAGGRIVAVGTTVVRTLESAFSGKEAPHFSGRTSLFIYPGYEFRAVGAMITNFHLPGSTLLMLVCAFGGRDFILKAYREAVRNEYRFFSYGDAMLIL